MTGAEATVRRIVAELARRRELGDILDREWSALGLDSLDVLELAVRCEEELGVEIPDQALAWCATPRAVVCHLDRERGRRPCSAGPEGGDGIEDDVVGVGPG